ncbi:MAG: hypothetical protein ABIJ84_00875 [bacterium]
MQKQKGISTLAGIVIIIVVAVIAFGGVFAYQYFATKTNNQLQVQGEEQNQQTNNVHPADQTAGWKTYTNESVGYKIEYPAIYSVKTSNCFADKKDGQKLNDVNSVNIGDSNLLTFHICHFNGSVDDLSKEDGFIPTTVGGLSAIKKEFEIRGGGRAWYYVQEDSSNVVFIDANWAYSGTYPNTVADEDFNKRGQTIHQMLSTFKFTK